MAIDLHVLNFLRFARKRHPLGQVVTIGRQEILLPEPVLAECATPGGDSDFGRFGEDLLSRHLGAESVTSVDNSDYEGAAIVHDMNRPLPEGFHGTFDTVVDGGCLEHIFNVPEALRNCSLLCKEGGQILHILPTNNFCGHGFWQMSPELFFSLYSEDNGYSETEVFLADVSDTTRWFRVRKPRHGDRVNVTSQTPLYVMVRTVLKRTDFTHENVQQSDYTYAWENGEAAGSAAPQDRKRTWRTTRLANRVRNVYLRCLRVIDPSVLYSRNPDLEEIVLKTFI